MAVARSSPHARTRARLLVQRYGMNAAPLADFTRAQLRQIEATDYVRMVCLRRKHHGFEHQALEEFRQRWPDSPLRARLERELKASIAPATTADASWGGPLMVASPSSEGFAEMIRANTILGRLPGIRKVPLNSILPVMTTGASAGWVGEDKSKPISAGAFASVPVGFFKASTIIVASGEQMKLQVPGAELKLQEDLRRALTNFFDVQAFDPAVTAVTNVRPASLTNGAPTAAATGTTAEAALSDVKALINAFIVDNPDAEQLVCVLSPATAAALAVATNSASLTVRGGSLFGIDVVTSASVAGMIILLDAAQIYLGEEAGIRVDSSEQAIVEMDSAPATPGTASTVYKTLWQFNLVGLRAEKFVAWKRARTNAVRYISNVAYA